MEWVRKHERWYLEPVLQIHDALINEYLRDKYKRVNALMIDALDEMQMFCIPITAKGKSGRKWSDL
jgi:DNA polymerase I-like protein with 3'-5' exonuclease and polymerase domains